MTTQMENFDYIKPKNLDQLAAQISHCQQQGHGFLFSAGGTDIIPQMKTGRHRPDTLISLSGLDELKNITRQGDKIIIGSLTSLSNLAAHHLIRDYLPTLGFAAHKVASPQIRNRATIGGNIMIDNRCSYINQSDLNRESHSPCFKADGEVCHIVKRAKRGDDVLCQARFVSDTAPVLLLLKAELNIMGQNSSRKIKLSELYHTDGIDCRNLKPGDIITSIEIDIPQDTAFHYEKLAIRKALDFPSLGVAVSLNSKTTDMAVALTGLNTHPGFFKVKSKDHGTFDEALSNICQQANDFAVTYNQDFFPRAYRKNMISVFIRRGVGMILEEQNQ